MLAILIGVWGSITGAIQAYKIAVIKREDAQCIARLARTGYTFRKKYESSNDLDYDDGGCFADPFLL